MYSDLMEVFHSFLPIITAVAPIVGSATYTSGNPALDFFYILFNGISEVPLFSSPVTGILIVSGVFLASKAGAMMVLSGLIGAGIAIIFGASYTNGPLVCLVITQF